MFRRPWQVTPGTALLPLRIFLGVTFVYAGFQKLADPNFLEPGKPTYIGTQLHGFAAGTPGGFLLRWFAEPFPALSGLGVAVIEIGIGLLVGFGLFTRWAAVGGLALNMLLYLTASWNTYPYFLGSDIVFVFAWLPFVLAGAAGQPSLDGYIEAKEHERAEQERRRLRKTGRQVAIHGGEAARAAAAGDRPVTRAVAIGSLAAATLAAVAGVFRGPATVSTAGLKPGLKQPGSPAGSNGAGTGGPGPAAPKNSVRLGAATDLKPGQAADYTDPVDGNPDILIRLSDGKLSALSGICTHAGCAVAYSGGVLYCPCHGSQFSPATGAVLQGPAVTALARKRVVQVDGQIYALRT